MIEKEIRVGHLCCGSGFGALGFRQGSARVGNLTARFRNIGGIDVDPAGIADFERFAGCKGTLLDLMSFEQYVAFHGRKPPAGWREATPADIHRAMGFERPHIWFISAPCKGFSGLLSEKASRHLKYQALNELTLRAVWLAMEAFKDDPVEFLLFENVPRIANRGRPLLDKIEAILAHYGYAFAETTHDCGELGGLAQSRKRFLLVARHREKVPPFLYEPPKRRLKGVGEILEKLPVPGVLTEGMHRLPRLQWKTWVRLAFVEAGSDWRSLNKLKVKDGFLEDYGIVPQSDWRDGILGVLGWDQYSGTVTASAEATNGRFNIADPRPIDATWQKSVLGVRNWSDISGTVTGRSTATTGAFSVADPRAPSGAGEYQQYGVRAWADTSGAVINVKSPGQGSYAVADPRTGYGARSHQNKFHIVDWDEMAKTVTGAHQVQGGGLSVADPRASGSFEGGGKYRVTAFDEAAGTVIGGSTTGQGAFAVADPRTFQGGKATYKTQSHYGVVSWDSASYSVPGYAKYDRGAWSVSDPRFIFSTSFEAQEIDLPEQDERLVAHITALDGTWHRPFTTLELAALQSLFDLEEWDQFEMHGESDSAWRERIGNAVPPAAARSIAGVMGRTLLLAWAGESFMLSADPIWVQPLTIALSVETPA
ncbi:MAG: DNA cytosine methyltransferase [Roseibium sp.]|nr:DNA cytosine methyltransferase [Roseibium sp.]